MATEDFKKNLTALLKGRFPLVFLTTNEEKRMISFFQKYCKVNGFKGLLWDCFQGLIDLETKDPVTSSPDIKNPFVVMEHILDHAKELSKPSNFQKLKDEEGVNGVIYLLLDFYRYAQKYDPGFERRLKAISNLESVITVVMTGPEYVSMPSADNLVSVIDFPFPNKEEIRNALWAIVNHVKNKIPEAKLEEATRKSEEELVKAVSGLTLVEAQAAYAKSIVFHRAWDIQTILEEKRQIIRKTGLLEFYNQNVTINDVGGLHNLVNWLKRRKRCFSKEAQEYGLKVPRGILAIGMPGCVLGDTKIKVKKISDKGNTIILSE